jgi:hypothetical protein
VRNGMTIERRMLMAILVRIGTRIGMRIGITD